MTADEVRVKYTFYLAVGGVAAVLVAFMVAVWVFPNSSQPAETIVAVLGPITGVVGTLAGYVGGQAAGAAGKEKAEERADTAQQRLQAIATTNVDVVTEARRRYPDLFKDPP